MLLMAKKNDQEHQNEEGNDNAFRKLGGKPKEYQDEERDNDDDDNANENYGNYVNDDDDGEDEDK